MAWKETTVDIENVKLTLELQTVDPATLFIDVFGVQDGDSIRYKAYLLFDETSITAEPGAWTVQIVDYGNVAAAMGSVGGATLTRETFGVRQGSSFKRRMILAWK
jgi:hypothetical protein